MVTIRLSRGGTTKRPFYHIVATDHRNRRDGRYLERLGYYNPIASGRENALQIDLARIDYWVSQGAQLSARASDLVEGYRATQQAAAA